MDDSQTQIQQARVTALESRVVYGNQWMTVREDDVRFPNGTTGIFGVVEKQDFAVVLPYEDGGFWLVEQFRYPVGRRGWEFPLGAWPQGHSGTSEELAHAELAEETGKRAASLTHLGRLQTVPGVLNNVFDVYLAQDLTSGAPDRESTESDMICEWRSEDELRAMIADGQFADAQSVAAYALYLLRPSDDREP